MGISQLLFVGQSSNGNEQSPDKAFVCPVCIHVFEKPVVLPNCKHTVCQPCLTNWKKTGKKSCPATECKRSLAIKHQRPKAPQRAFLDMLANLRFHCSFKGTGGGANGFGCNVIVRHDEFRQHELVCPFNPQNRCQLCNSVVEEGHNCATATTSTAIAAQVGAYNIRECKVDLSGFGVIRMARPSSASSSGHASTIGPEPPSPSPSSSSSVAAPAPKRQHAGPAAADFVATGIASDPGAASADAPVGVALAVVLFVKSWGFPAGLTETARVELEQDVAALLQFCVTTTESGGPSGFMGNQQAWFDDARNKYRLKDMIKTRVASVRPAMKFSFMTWWQIEADGGASGRRKRKVVIKMEVDEDAEPGPSAAPILSIGAFSGENEDEDEDLPEPICGIHFEVPGMYTIEVLLNEADHQQKLENMKKVALAVGNK